MGKIQKLNVTKFESVLYILKLIKAPKNTMLLSQSALSQHNESYAQKTFFNSTVSHLMKD